MIGPTDITLVFGMRGSGKSTLTRRLSSIYPRRIIFDRLQEWNSTDGQIVKNFTEFSSAYSTVRLHDSFSIIYQTTIEVNDESQSHEFNQILRVIYKDGRTLDENTLLLFEEIHLYAEPTSIEPWLKECILTGRHSGLAIMGNSQRPASVHKSLVSQAQNLFVGQLYEPRDMQYLSDAMGNEAFRAKSIEKYNFLYFSPGKPIQIVKNT